MNQCLPAEPISDIAGNPPSEITVNIVVFHVVCSVYCPYSICHIFYHLHDKYRLFSCTFEIALLMGNLISNCSFVQEKTINYFVSMNL